MQVFPCLSQPRGKIFRLASVWSVLIFLCGGVVGGEAPAHAQDSTRAQEAPPAPAADTASAEEATGRRAIPASYVEKLQWRQSVAQPSPRQEGDSTGTSVLEGVTLDGIVINETSSTIGSDFYDVFYSRWQAPQGTSNFTVRIREQYTPSLGSVISVEVNGVAIYQGYLQPNFDEVEQAARQARSRTVRYLRQRYQPREVY